LGESISGVDLDLDLDFSLDEGPASAISDLTIDPPGASESEQTVKMPSIDLDSPMDMGMDFDLSDLEPTPALHSLPEPPTPLPDVPLSMDGLKLDDDDLHALPDFNATAPMQIAAAEQQPPPAQDMGMLEFDMSSLSLDLEPPVIEKPTEAPESVSEDPLETKLALAEEFVSIGDEDGARALIEEVVAEATGDMRAKAQRALANLS
jgi:pilus assembly protein FimV